MTKEQLIESLQEQNLQLQEQIAKTLNGTIGQEIERLQQENGYLRQFEIMFNKYLELEKQYRKRILEQQDIIIELKKQLKQS